MDKPRFVDRWSPSKVPWIAGAIVLLGFGLTGISWWFLLLVAAGTLVPGALREFGVLNDRDEYQRRSDYRAGYHAFLVTALLGFVLVAYFRSGDREIKIPQELATLFLVFIWCSWFFSSLFAYWGSKKTAARLLYAFGLVWLTFTIVSNLGSEWNGWQSFFLHPLLSVPFFAFGWASGRWPKVTGCLLIAIALFFIYFFRWFQGRPTGLITDAVTFILFNGPLLASGIALIVDFKDMDSDDE